MLTRILALGGLVAVAACARSYPSTQMQAVATEARGSCAADADCGSNQLCVDRACHDVAGATVAACTERPIHFATNSAVIDSRNRAELNDTAVCLRSDRDVRVIIAGNADERGGSDYNRELAQRRADAVAGYLEAAGVQPKQLDTVTYGADNPMCNSQDEACWQQNRRVEIMPHNLRAKAGDAARNKHTTDEDAASGRRIDSTGHGTDNGSPVGKE